MGFKNILISTDGSKVSKMVIERGLDFAKKINANVTAVYVLDYSTYSVATDVSVDNIYEILKEEGLNAVKYVTEEGRKRGMEITEHIAEGSPGTTIANMSSNYDLIIMGTFGRTGISKMLMGSVSEKVIHKSSCPVMIIRNTASKDKNN